ncbi:MAG: hypothetical protein ABEI97_02820 [Candidatus Nanohaloarchaea archaeon]
MVDRDSVTVTARRLAELAPRMWENEAEAAALIREELDSRGIDYRRQEYDVVYPEFPVYELVVDGEELDCLPAGFASGEITEKRVVNNLEVTHGDLNQPNLNFNPQCHGLSKQTFYEAPALTIARSDVHKVLEADEIDGRLEVEWVPYTSENIIVGNAEDPKLLVFTHYDSWWGGFIDNAFSVSLLIHLLPDLDLDRVCIVFAGSEEVSDEEQYWCYGYRRFEDAYVDAVENADRIAVVDTVGRGETQIVADDDFLIGQALVLDSRSYVDKTELLIGDFDAIMEIYHSPLDTEDAATHMDHAIDTVTDYLDRWMA